MSNRRWQLDDPYIRMKLDIVATAQPIYIGRRGSHAFEVTYTPEVMAKLAAVDQLRTEYDQFLLNLKHDQYAALCSGLAWDDALDHLRFGIWGTWPRDARKVRQMANYNARSAT